MAEQNVSNTLVSCVKLGMDLGDTAGPFSAAVVRLSSETTAQSVVNTFWLFHVLQVPRTPAEHA